MAASLPNNGSSDPLEEDSRAQKSFFDKIIDEVKRGDHRPVLPIHTGHRSMQRQAKTKRLSQLPRSRRLITMRSFSMLTGILAFYFLATGALSTIADDTPGAIDIGSRRELFVDDFLIDRIEGLRREQQTPIDRGKVVGFEQPWEGDYCNYVHIFKDTDRWRMYYRGARAEFEIGETGSSNICLAESVDGL